jgi:hypothetical protein
MSDPYAGTFDEITEGRKPANGRGKPIRFKLTPFEEIQLSKAPNYLVKGILPREGIAVIWGPPKCGKSFWTFDLLMHVALGWKYRGRRVQQGSVVYLALEGGKGFAARVEAWRRQHLNGHRGRVPFSLISVPINLIADHDELIRAIKMQLGEERPAAVAVDTLNRALLGDENKSDDMAKFIRASDAIRIAFDCLVPIVHHCGVQGGRPRGHTSLSGADDVQIAIVRDKEDNIIATVEHAKDHEAGAKIASKLERVELGLDDDGDPISSCVVVPTEAAAPAPKLTGAAKMLYDLLRTLTATESMTPQPDNNIPAKVRPVSALSLRDRFYDGWPSNKPDTKQKAYVRAVLKLQEENLLEIWSTYAWLTN